MQYIGVFETQHVLMYYAGVNDEAQLPYIDYAKTFSNYLLSHGMNSQQLEALIKVLTVN